MKSHEHDLMDFKESVHFLARHLLEDYDEVATELETFCNRAESYAGPLIGHDGAVHYFVVFCLMEYLGGKVQPHVTLCRSRLGEYLHSKCECGDRRMLLKVSEKNRSLSHYQCEFMELLRQMASQRIEEG